MKCEACLWGRVVGRTQTELLDKTTVVCSRPNCLDFPNERTIEMKKPLIYVCSPLAGDMKKNIERASRYCRFVSGCNSIPIAPHLYFTRFLDDSISEERNQGIEMGLEILKVCDAVWVFGNKMSGGMRSEIQLAKQLGKPMMFFDQTCQPSDECHLIDPLLGADK
jgi:hypothetical protein